MPKFMTYQRPVPVDKANWGGKPGTSWGKPGKQAPKPAPEVKIPNLETRLSPLPKSR